MRCSPSATTLSEPDSGNYYVNVPENTNIQLFKEKHFLTGG